MDETETQDPVRNAKDAKQVVTNYALASLWPGIFPIPILDAALLLALQLKMVHRLAKLYGTPFSKELGRTAIAALVGAGGSVHLALLAGPLLKTLPGIGPFAGLATMTTFGGASTYAVGQVFVQHFESGGTLLTFDPEKVRSRYRELYDEWSASGSAGKRP